MYNSSRRIYCLNSYENNSDFDVRTATLFIITPLEEYEED